MKNKALPVDSAKRKKIAILTPTFDYYSGIDRVAELQAINFSNKNDVTVFALQGTIKPKGYSLDILGMPKSIFMQRIYRLFFFLDFFKIKKTAEKLKDCDIVISHFYPMNWIAGYARKKYGVRYVYHNHGIGYSGLFADFFEKIYMRLFSFFNKISLKNADEAISISRFMQSELKKETGIDSKVVYNKIDTKKFKKKLDKNRIRNKLKIKSNEKLLLFVGRLSPHKNIHNLIKIFDMVNGKIPNSKLLIVGKPTFPDYFNRLNKSSNKNIIFLEDVKDGELPYYYSACDLYVTASLWEGFNLPLAEAQACGKKVVAFDVCSHPEIIKNGVLVKNGDLEGFAKAIIKLLNK